MTTAAHRLARSGWGVVDRLRSSLSPSASKPAGPGRSASGWLAVTVLRDPDDVDEAAPPSPLAELGHDIEVRVRPAPADRGTELWARLREAPAEAGAPRRLSGEDAEADLRSALRRAKQLLEVGEVLAVDPAPHGERKATPGNAALRSWTEAAPRAGVR